MDLAANIYNPRLIWWVLVALTASLTIVGFILQLRLIYERRRRFSIDLTEDPSIIARRLWRRARARGQTGDSENGTTEVRASSRHHTSLLRYILHKPSRARTLLGALAVLFLLSPSLEFVANDRPIFIWYKGLAHFPTLIKYQETKFDGDFETQADYRDPDVQKLISGNAWAVWPPVPFDASTNDLTGCEIHPAPPRWSPWCWQSNRRLIPADRHWLGTDDQSRDVLTRILYGSREYLLLGVMVTLIASLAGITIPAVRFLLRIRRGRIPWIVRTMRSMPILLILMIILSTISNESGAIVLVIVLGLFFSIVSGVRIDVDLESYMRAGFVRAGEAFGQTRWRVWRQHLQPIAIDAAIAQSPIIAGQCVAMLLALDFFGLGLPPGSPSLGEMLSQAKANIQAPWIGVSALAASALIFLPISALAIDFDRARTELELRRFGMWRQ
jgi:microcin C transport system permease protein